MRVASPKSKCIAVGEFAGDIGIWFKVDMDFVMDGIYRETRGVNRRKKCFW